MLAVVPQISSALSDWVQMSCVCACAYACIYPPFFCRSNFFSSFHYYLDYQRSFVYQSDYLFFDCNLSTFCIAIADENGDNDWTEKMIALQMAMCVMCAQHWNICLNVCGIETVQFLKSRRNSANWIGNMENKFTNAKKWFYLVSILFFTMYHWDEEWLQRFSIEDLLSHCVS